MTWCILQFHCFRQSVLLLLFIAVLLTLYYIIIYRKDIRIPKSSNTFRRGPRRVAHAFVTLGSAKEVEKAVETLNEKTFGDKTVTVNVARPKTETEDKPKAKKAAARGEKSADASAATEASGETDKAAKKDATSSKSSPKKKSKAFKKEPIPGSVSHEDTIFVSNLPFGVKKEQLSELFKDLEPQWTYISMGSVPRPTGSFKYVYGFVKFSDSAAQEKALKDYSEVSLGNRKLRVAAAKERVPTAESEATEDSTSTTKTSPPASASASPETKETEA